jgi:hypothetical protein
MHFVRVCRVTRLLAAFYRRPALAATTQSTSSLCSPIYSIGHKSSTETWSFIYTSPLGEDTLEFNSSGSRTSLCSADGYGGVFIEWDGGCLEPETNYAGEGLVTAGQEPQGAADVLLVSRRPRPAFRRL